jgi:cobalt-zinc-cadmium efflux system protein
MEVLVKIQSEKDNASLKRRATKLKAVLLLTSFYFVIQVTVALYTRSLALLSDAGHMFADVGGLALILFAVNYSRKPATLRHTYGFYRIEILAALLNSLILILISVYVLYEASIRIFQPPQIHGLPVIVVAAVGLAVNFVGMRLLGSSGHAHVTHTDSGHKASERQEIQEEGGLMVKSAYLEVLSDMLGAAAVIASGVIILTTGFYLADPLVSIGLAIFILLRTWSLIKKSIHILMEGVPANISLEEVKNAILEIRGVTGVFDLHIWTITSGMNAISAHVVIIDRTRPGYILQEINAVLEKKFKVNHATIQIETYHSEPN